MCLCATIHSEVRGQLAGVHSAPCASQRLNLGPQRLTAFICRALESVSSLTWLALGLGQNVHIQYSKSLLGSLHSKTSMNK